MMKTQMSQSPDYWVVRRATLRRERRAALGTLVCANCGSTDQDAIEFDHVDPSEKTDDIAYAIARYPHDRFRSELAKTQPLCHDCHRRKYSWWHYNGRNWKVRDCGTPPVGFNRSEAVWLGYGFLDE